MPLVSPKGSLPYGWTVQRSKNYPDRVYYFNIHTGVSSWECPELDPPRVLSEDEVTEIVMNFPVTKKRVIESPPQNYEKGIKVCEEKTMPPTAVVVPVVHKQNGGNQILNREKKRSKKKKKPQEPVEGPKSKEPDVPNERISKKRKLSSSEDSCHGNKVHPCSSSGNTAEQTVNEQAAGSSSSESNIKDVEMRDVSMDLLDDLSEKKETVFDTTACYYIVVDTNVLIREIHLINELKDTPLDGCGPPHIFIPWVVIEELDKLKSQRNIKNLQRPATEVIRYLNSVLSKHPRFHGQSPAEAEEWAKTYSKCNDDKILECCMALQDKMPAEKVILLTNDKNLVNKALICKIQVHNFESMMKKVKPDTVFNYEELKMNKKKRKENEELQSPLVSCDSLKEKILQSKRDVCKRQIHSIMSNARLLLKDILKRFVCKEMLEAYGEIWLSFKVDVNLLEGLLKGVKRYWAAVFSLFFSETDKRNFELLLEKVSRPEGFLGDKDECLVILSTIEDVFRQMQKRQPKLRVSVEQIQNYRIACINAFVAFTEAESSLRAEEEQSIRNLLDNNWTYINQLCGMILDYYEVPHTLDYEKTNQISSDFEMRRILSILYPAVQLFRKLLKSIHKDVKDSKPAKKQIKKLSAALLEFIPSLGLPGDVSFKYPFFSSNALGRFLTCPQNREMLEVGINQIEYFYTKLEESLRAMLRGRPEPETMICD